MTDGGQKFFQKIAHRDLDAGCVDTGMAAYIRDFKKVFVDQQLYLLILVIDQTHDTDRTWPDIQQFDHPFFRCESQAGRPYFFRDLTGAEGFFARHDQQIEVCLPAVA